ncbi:antibiotic biosynthesis monooxygenase [Sediminicola sp. YIK13]|uniref:putative quinol monooxygenase n=1 Tax=Sediminicola sp. YIK13 TaxID=1453352 RepID=UPI0007206AF0|nr:antibiotic biosynthesis monooxygenase family protein [Sediminicola sp. YIK13]ALM06812.1 antibiotic biosynthesis monooxygenase [Sediminicola sp. YIK13]
MFVRIVKLTFKKENIASFEQIFEDSKNLIRNVEGCTFLELLQDKDQPNIFFTYSYWQSEENLDNYRNSTLFKNIWGQTKALFAERAEAWSVDKKITLN